MNKPIKDVDSRFEGFICPACLVDFSTASQVQDHWLKFHSTSKPNSTASGQKDEKSHKFKLTFFGIAETCGVCHNDVVNYEGMYCEVCHFICHKKCEEMVKSKCGKRPSLSINTGSHSFRESSKNDGYLGYRLPKVQSPSAHKGIVKHLRHIVSKGRVRHVDKEFDLDLTYINDRVIAMSFPATGLETTYRNNLRDVAKMLQSKHQDKYMVFNLSERRYDISKLHHQVLDFGWPDHLAPPLERLCSIIKSIDSWLKSDPDHVVVVHCKGGKGRTGVVISAYMHFSKICSSPEAALDWFAMKRFYDDKLGGVTQPSQRRYVHYFSDYLDGKIKLSSDPIFLHHVIVHGIPNFDGKGGCKPFLRVYDGLKLIYTSGVFYVTQEMERICITIEGGLILHGDVLIKCYHKNTLSSGGDIIVRCQFHTGAIKDYSLVLDKMELDEAYRDKRFADGCKVEFVFSATGNFVTGIQDNVRLQSIIRNSLQPIENPDTVLMIPTADGQDEENWADSEGSSASTQELTKSTTKSLNARQTCEDNNSGFGGRTRNHSGPTYVPGPLDGSLYAQVDKNLKKQIRSYSLDSGIHTRGSRDAEILDKPVLHSYKTGPLTSQETATLNRYQFSRNPKKVSSDGDITMDADLGGNIHSIDKLLKELGECSELLDNTIQQGRKSSERTTPNLTFQELSSIPIQTSQTGFKPINSSQTGSKPVYPPTPLRRAASYNATERYLEERHGVPAKVARKISNETRANNGIGGPYPSPSYTSTPKRQGIQEAPALKTHTRSLSPKFYATQTVVPSKTTVGQSRTPEDNPIGGEPRTKGYAIGDSVDVRFGGVNGYHDNDVVMGSRMNGKGGEGDVNNNRTPTQNGDIENDEFRNEEDEFPRKGNVASKVAFLTEIVFPAQPPAERLPLKGTVPMPGLVGKSQTDISDEISKHNAKSLAVGELSHGGNTLYRGGAPQKISEAHPGRKDLSDKTLDPELVNKLKKVRDKSEVFDNEDLQTQPTEAQNVETESYDDGIDYKHTRARQDAQPGSPPVFMSNGPRDFTVGQPVLFSIPTDTKPSGRIDEDGYAELDDIHTTHHFARIEQAKPSPIVISRDIHTQPSMVAVLSSEPGNIQAIDGILSEMADINLAMPKENYDDDDDNAGRPPTPQTPSSSISGPFDNTPRKKRSPFHSDKGYGSTNSLSSESSSNDVFVESPPAVPGVKFDKDTSQYWYKPSISREEAISLLKDKEPGYFVVRDSQSFPGAYGLAVRVAVPPAHVLQGDLTKIDLNIELIRHFLIESTKKGVKLRGISNEPVFGSLSALIFQHTITPLSLPIRLVIPTEDLLPSSSITDKTDGPASPKSPTTDTMQLMFVGECGVEMLSGTSAIQKTVESLLAYSAEPKFTSTSVRITKQGITVTDNERKVFFRKHFPINNVVYCGIDPLDQRWDLKIPSYTEKSRTFGLVVRKMGEIGNDCHLFAEMDSNYPINTVVNIVNKYMTG